MSKGVEVIVKVDDKEFLHIQNVTIDTGRRATLDNTMAQRIEDAIWEAYRYNRDQVRDALHYTLHKEETP